MVRLANVSGKTAVRAFMKMGYEIARQTGSHIILRHESRPTLTVPDHKELAPGLLRSIIRQAGVTVEAFIEKSVTFLSFPPGNLRMSLPRRSRRRR